MPTLAPTFVREGNQIIAFYDDQRIAQGTVFAEVEKSAVDYLDHLESDMKESSSGRKRATATRIKTPNGLKGEILGRTNGQWGEELITVRLENGRIARYEAHGGNDKDIKYKQPKKSSEDSALEYLQKILEVTPEGTKQSLAHRIDELNEVIEKAAGLTRTASFEDQKKADTLVLSAEHEQREVREALEYLLQSDAETFEPPAPFKTGAVEQASVGGGNGSWLDSTINEMLVEASSEDFDKLLSEGPLVFIAELDTGALADQGVTREMALSHITSKTAAYQGDEVESYREQFLAKTEQARRDELKERTAKAKKKAEKKAKKEKTAGVIDDALFL